MYSSEKNVKKFPKAPLSTDYNLHHDVTTCITTPGTIHLADDLGRGAKQHFLPMETHDSMERPRLQLLISAQRNREG